MRFNARCNGTKIPEKTFLDKPKESATGTSIVMMKPMPAHSPLLQTIRLTPLPVSVPGVADFKTDLNGTWNFHPCPDDGFYKHEHGAGREGWRGMEIPGEWAMQGAVVQSGTAADYRRSFTTPESWNGQRVRLRCDAIYSDARIWVNRQEAFFRCRLAERSAMVNGDRSMPGGVHGLNTGI